MLVKNQEACRTPNRHYQKRNSICHRVVKTQNVQKKERILKSHMRKRKTHVQKQTHKNNFRFFDGDHESLKELELCFESYDRSDTSTDYYSLQNYQS